MNLWILRNNQTLFEQMIHSMPVALFWKSMGVLEESVGELVQHPLEMSEIFDYTKTLLLDSIENISLKWELSKF